MDNANSSEYLEKIKIQVIENMKHTTFAPSVQMTDVPRDPEGYNDEADAILDDQDEDDNKDVRHTARRWDKYVEKDGELSDSDEENDPHLAANGVRSQGREKRRRNITDYPNPHAAPLGMDDDEVGLAPSGLESRASEPSADDRVATANGDGANGTSDVDRSASPSVKSSPRSPTALVVPDADVEMADGPTVDEAGTLTEGGPQQQEATPPESPKGEEDGTDVNGVAVATTNTPAELPHETNADEVMGDAEEEPSNPAEQEEGIQERAEEGAAAEKTAELEKEEEQL